MKVYVVADNFCTFKQPKIPDVNLVKKEGFWRKILVHTNATGDHELTWLRGGIQAVEHYGLGRWVDVILRSLPDYDGM